MNFKKLIQKPLRFHHQDIHDEMDELKQAIFEIKDSLSEIKEWMKEKETTGQKSAPTWKKWPQQIICFTNEA